jgi:hypothetical protein
MGKRYTLTFYDLLNLTEKVISKTKDGKTKSYLSWVVMSERDYIEEGIVKNIKFTQNFAKTAFVRAFTRYRIQHFDFNKILIQNKSNHIDARVTFERENAKRMIIHDIDILY